MKKLDPGEAAKLMVMAGLMPLEPFQTSKAKWKCKCLKCGRTTFPAHGSIKQNPKSGGCNFCAKEQTQAVLRARNLRNAMSYLASQDLKIGSPYRSAKTSTIFECQRCGAHFQSTYMDVKSGRRVCACKRLPRKPLSLARPDLAGELHKTANGLKTADTIGTGMRSDVWWTCSNNHEYLASPANRVGGTGCRFCKGMEAFSGETDLFTLFPDLCRELAFPEDIELAAKTRPGSGMKISWRCSVNSAHIYQMSPFDRTTLKAGCSYCAGKRVLEGDNDFASNYPEIASEWDYVSNFPIRPEMVHKGSNTKYAWICNFDSGHRWNASPHDRQTRGCQSCSRFQTGRNDLKTKATELGRTHLLREWDSSRNAIDPDQISYSSGDLAYWICPKAPTDHRYQAKISNRWYGSTGCPTCSPSSYDSNSPGILYFIENENLGARKIGITNVNAKTKRVEKFIAAGWKIISTYTNPNGLLIRRTEEVILRRIREEFGLPQYLSPSEMRGMGGATETFSNSGVANETLLREIDYEYQRSLSKLDVARLDFMTLA